MQIQTQDSATAKCATNMTINLNYEYTISWPNFSADLMVAERCKQLTLQRDFATTISWFAPNPSEAPSTNKCTVLVPVRYVTDVALSTGLAHQYLGNI